MTESASQPGWAFRAINGRTLQSVNWMNNKLNVLPGFHLLFCAIGATVLGGAAKLALDWMGGDMAVDGMLGQALGSSERGPLHALYGSLKVSSTHMPHREDWGQFQPETLSELAKNDWLRNLHRYAPPLFGVFGVLLGSKVFFESRGINKKVRTDAANYQNILTDQRQAQIAQSQANGVLSGLLANTGGGSLRAFSGGEMTWGRFLPGVGDFNGLPLLRRLLHGKGISGEFNHAGIKILEDHLLPYLATARDDQLDRSYVKRAVKGILGPLFSEYSEQDVEGLTDGLIQLRSSLLEAQPDSKASLISVMGETVVKGWDQFMQTHSSLKPEDAHIEGHGGLFPSLAHAISRIPLIGSGKIRDFRAIYDASQARYGKTA